MLRKEYYEVDPYSQAYTVSYGMTTFDPEDYVISQNTPRYYIEREIPKRVTQGLGFQGKGWGTSPLPKKEEEEPPRPPNTKRDFFEGLLKKVELTAHRSVPAPKPYRLAQSDTSFTPLETTFAQSLQPRDNSVFEIREKQRSELSKSVSEDKGIRMKKPHHKPVIASAPRMKPLVRIVKPETGVPPPPPKWVPVKDEDGDVYYYNVKTRETRWELPPGLSAV